MIKASNILTQEELEYLKQLYSNSPKRFYPQDVNLFSVYKVGIGTNNSDLWYSIQQKFFKFHGRVTSTTNYFLEYQVGSYAQKHRDNPDTVEGTAVTLLDKSDDIVGGDVVVGQGNNERILPLSVGETMYYTAAVDHGVTKVERGSRIVLITWFRKDTWQS